MIKRFLADTLVYGAANVVARGLPFLTLPIYALFLKPEDFGIIDLAIVLTALLKLTIALEITQAVARFFPDAENPDEKRSLASSSLWFSILMYTLMVLLFLPFTSEISLYLFSSQVSESLIVIIILSIWTEGVFYLIQNQLRYQLESFKYGQVTLLHAALSTLIALLLMYMGMGVSGFFYGLLISGIVSIMVAYLMAGESFTLLLDWQACKKLLRFSVPLVPSSIAVFSTIYIDRLCINYYMDLNALGVYGIAHRIAMVAGLALAGIQVALTPLIYQHYKEADTPLHLEQIFRLFLLAVLPLYILVSLFSETLVTTLSSTEFLNAAIIVPWLAGSILLANMYIFTPGLFLEKKTTHIMWINISGACLNLLLNIILIPRFGLSGAAISTLVSSAAVFILYLRGGQKHYPVPFAWPAILSAIVTTVVAISLGLTMGESASIIISLIAITVITLCLFDREEFTAFSSIFKLIRQDRNK